jgi:hypothetical protein
MLMNKLLSIAGALLIMAGPAMIQPAEAQSFYYNNNRFNNRWDNNRWDNRINLNRMQNRMQQRLTQGLRRGNLTQREYQNLMRRYNEVAQLEARLRVGGLSFQERRQLQNRILNLNAAIQRNFYDRQYAGNSWWY